ncbi:MAG TPA: sigma-54 dependent transcriptional regulator [Anaeromyxobacteraceae bacterium]|nr:sigma-54 dependent transcriptional regulator [Anaeromyxobacteraceae bacterium]
MTTTPRPRVLVVDDNPEMARMLCDALSDGYDARPESHGPRAVELLSTEGFDAVVTDLRMPGADGLDVLAASRATSADRPVIVMTAHSAVDTAVESIRRGAYHYLTKPFKVDELRLFLARALEEVRLRLEARALRGALRERLGTGQLLGSSRRIQAVLDVVERVAASTVPVLLTGETGTGKGLLARVIHAQSGRTGPLVVVNCAALPDNLLESELFGHVRGAFTGAATSRPGLFAEASRGTLFLDEIGEMPLPLQAKLLRVLESGAVRPVGAEREIPVDVRIVAASNRDLAEASRAGSFREDLLYRLDVVRIELPPLRHRREDVVPLAQHFLAEARARHPGATVQRFSTAASDLLAAHDWPGNVRELQHVVERAVVLSRGDEVGPEDLPAWPGPSGEHGPATFEGPVVPVRQLQRRYAAWALEQCGGHRGRTAERLGVDAKTLARWLAPEEPGGP